METERDLLMYYQTTLRNTGLFTTLSFAALSYSRYYRGKGHLFNVSLIIVSMIFMTITLILARYLVEDSIKWKKEINTKSIDKYLLLPRVIFVVNALLLVLAFYTLIRELMK